MPTINPQNMLDNLTVLSTDKTRSISAENPEGKRGFGGQEGGGRKGRPCISLPKGKKTTLADIKGPGVIQHIWITLPDRTEDGPNVLRNLVLRMYWDGQKQPSVEAPLGDFFGQGFGLRHDVNSLMLLSNPNGGLNSYWPMPFAKSCKITVENQHFGPVGGFFYQIDYALRDELPKNTAYFHAQWRRENPTVKGVDHTILDAVKGPGHYVGTYFAWAPLERSWWGEGEIKFYMDGDKKFPTICGTGAEDYVCGAWCFGRTYSTPFLGYTLYNSDQDNAPQVSMYRWHVLDPIRFEKDLRVTIQQIGHNGRHLYDRADDVSTVAYWYQTLPTGKFPKLGDAEFRRPR